MKKLPISGLNAFRSIARQGSIRKGAAALELEPSTVSHQLKALEAEHPELISPDSPRFLRYSAAGGRLAPIVRAPKSRAD